MDVATLVRKITTAFEKALTLVERIQKRKESQDEALEDLLQSLSLGPTIVNGYYESGTRRFGGLYMKGDTIATEQLKDALIELQETVLSSLDAVFWDDKQLDYDSILNASDECRNNVGVCLGQLLQRMAKASKEGLGRTTSYDNGRIQRSSSHSTQSSVRPPQTPLTPPEEPDCEQFGDAGHQTRSQYVARAPDFDDMMHSASYSGLYSSVSVAPLPLQRSNTMPVNSLDSPVSPQELVSPITFRPRESSTSTSTNSSRGNPNSMYQSGPEGYEYNTRSIDAHSQPNHSNRLPYNELTSATLGQGLSSNLVPVERRPPSSYTGSISTQRSSLPEDEKEVYYPPAIPTRSMSRPGPRPQPAPNPYDIARRASTVPLNLPTEKNLMGFCKGAVRFMGGMDEKAFKECYRPYGNYGRIEYWKCSKCYFEGPSSSVIPPGSNKAVKRFDPTIRDHGGIRYKWRFLAKSHVFLKREPDGKRDGSYGSFACIFCAAEGVQRGWPSFTTITSPESASLRGSTSSTQTQTPTGGTPVFGNLLGLMDHLELHRKPEYWPDERMQDRLNCIVGRTAQRGEDFDINLLPLQPAEM